MLRVSVSCLFALSLACSERGAPSKHESETSASPPAPTAGAELIGTAAPAWRAIEWTTPEPLSLDALRGRVVVVRFWTNTCPYCERSMPALQQLADEYADRPVTFVGLYHSKPFGSERPWSEVTATLDEWKITFPVGYDREWSTVKSWWLDDRGPTATSASFVIGADGTYAHVHPGPVYFPGDGGDFDALRAAIDRELAKLDES